MWLINTVTLQLEALSNPEEHAYAILSHTWEHEEVTFHEMSDLDQAKTKHGFSKNERTCQLARNRGLQYAWVDTCCIDKKSSAELTEAINSMFQWYKMSTICFVFLSDLAPALELNTMADCLPQCRWFERGWTLQELVAPKYIDFYDQEWTRIGDKVSLQRQLTEKTKIDVKVLEDSDRISSIPVARRMSWAAKRRTSRVETLSYCLFGIFSVNLPLIYGEGPKAFIRFQGAIVAGNNDLSLFAWTSQDRNQVLRGIFARSPAEFQGCGSVQRILDSIIPEAEFALTNRSVRFTTRLGISSCSNTIYQMSLQCIDSSIAPGVYTEELQDAIIVINLLKSAHGYVRHGSKRLEVVYYSEMERNKELSFCVPKDIGPSESRSLDLRLSQRFAVVVENMTGFSCDIQKIAEHLWQSDTNTFITDGHEKFIGLLDV